MAASGVLADNGLAGAVLQVENFVFHAVHIDGDVAAGDR
jgi:hypothetical protein